MLKEEYLQKKQERNRQIAGLVLALLEKDEAATQKEFCELLESSLLEAGLNIGGVYALKLVKNLDEVRDALAAKNFGQNRGYHLKNFKK